MNIPQHDDLIIAGAGAVGAMLSLLAHSMGLRAQWVSPQPLLGDDRLLAMNPRSQHYLERLGVWQQLPISSVSAIIRVEIRLSRSTVTTLHARDFKLPALGYAISSSVLMSALAAQVAHRKIALSLGWRVAQWQNTDHEVLASLVHQDGHTKTLAGSLLLMASGSPPIMNTKNVPQATPASTSSRKKSFSWWSWCLPASLQGFTQYDYGLTGWMMHVDHPVAARDKAVECFEDDGVVALIPGGKGFKAIVLKKMRSPSASPESDMLLQWISVATGLPRGGWACLSEPQVFNPALHTRDNVVDDRVVWLGNAAHTLSPVGGQGLNLAIHEAWLLMEKVVEQGRNAKALVHFQQDIYQESLATIAATHWMTRAHDLPKPLLSLAGRSVQHFPRLSAMLGKRLMWGSPR